MHDHPEDPFDCLVALPGWRLHASFLIRREERDLGNVMEVALRGSIAEARKCAADDSLAGSETTAAIRRDLVDLGVDPASVPPASERLIEVILEDPRSAEGCLAWQFLVVLTLKSRAPWTALDGDRIEAPLTFRLGEEGESLPHRDGVLSCVGLPVLAGREGVLASPWTLPLQDELAGCTEPVFFCFLPAPQFRKVEPMAHMGRVMWTTWAYSFSRQRSYSPSVSR